MNMKKLDIPGEFNFIIGERAEEALFYILNEEDRMNRTGMYNTYFYADLAENMIRFYKEAAEIFEVRIFDSFSGRQLAGERM